MTRRRAEAVLAGAILIALLAVVAWRFSGCRSEVPPPREPRKPPVAAITQILLAYRSPRAVQVTRTKDEARTLGYALIERVRKGERLEALVSAFTDDRKEDGTGTPYNDGVFLIVKGGPAIPSLQRAVFATEPGKLYPEPFDTGIAYMVFRRDS